VKFRATLAQADQEEFGLMILDIIRSIQFENVNAAKAAKQ